jgi:hypothetical protein
MTDSSCSIRLAGAEMQRPPMDGRLIGQLLGRPVSSGMRLGWRNETMNKETPRDDPRQQADQGSHKQTEKPWKGNPEKEQRNEADIDLEKWHRTNTH